MCKGKNNTYSTLLMVPSLVYDTYLRIVKILQTITLLYFLDTKSQHTDFFFNDP